MATGPDRPVVWKRSLKELRAANDARARFRALGPGRIVTFDHEGRMIRLHVPHALKDKMQIYALLMRGFHELPLLRTARRFIAPGDRVIDAGANFGNHTVYFGAVCGAEVISVEPQADVFAVLERNRALNGVAGAAHRAAAGARAGSARFVKARGDNSGSARFEEGPGAVPLVALDAIAADRPVRLIKVDVEGMQMELLDGAAGILARDRPALWMELRPGHDEIAAPSARLAAMGYARHQMSWRDFLFLPGGCPPA
jgi:FkbM family methyltransferase